LSEEGGKEHVMLSRFNRFVFVACLVLSMVSSNVWGALAADEAIEVLANRLDESQEKEGGNRGLWLPEVLFAGPPAAGMALAYELTADPGYWETAELAGYYILWFTDIQGNMLGDEVYAFVELSRNSADPTGNVWRAALEEWFYSMRRPGYEEFTWDYIQYFNDMEASTAVFYIAQQMIGAYYVDDVDKEVWHEALIQFLSRVDDESTYPVMALGVATWAFASTNTLDATPLDGDASSTPYWDGMVVSDLPALLASHQVPLGEEFGGSFYWRYDHTAGDTGGVVAGYTEDAIYGTLGLVAAAQALEATDANTPVADEEDPNAVVAALDFESRIGAARQALLQGVDEEGFVFEHLSLVGETRYAYAGEMLQVLCQVKQYLDATVEEDGLDVTAVDAELEEKPSGEAEAPMGKLL
jgi:hypothetical protein